MYIYVCIYIYMLPLEKYSNHTGNPEIRCCAKQPCVSLVSAMSKSLSRENHAIITWSLILLVTLCVKQRRKWTGLKTYMIIYNHGHRQGGWLSRKAVFWNSIDHTLNHGPWLYLKPVGDMRPSGYASNDVLCSHASPTSGRDRFQICKTLLCCFFQS